MIFMKLRSRSSRATGPKIRVPRGLLAVASRTAAFSSKRIKEPSGRLYSLLTRTTTAFTTSPFLTWPPGCALDRGGDDVPHVGVLAVVAAGHADDQELLRPRVVRDLEPGFLLDHAITLPSPRSRARASASPWR